MKKIKTIKINSLFIIVAVFIFLCLIFKLVYIGTGHIKVNGSDLKDYAAARQTTKRTIYAKRGSIYSSSGEVLAKDVNSYTVIAYLSSDRTKDPKHPHHVVDKETTAKALSPYINMTEKRIMDILNTTVDSCD